MTPKRPIGKMEQAAIDFAAQNPPPPPELVAEMRARLRHSAADNEAAIKVLDRIGKVTSRKPDPKFRGQE